MAKPYSIDLRERVVAAVVRGGLSRRSAAAQFGVGISSVIRWVQRFRESGSVAPGQMGGHKPKAIRGDHRDWLAARIRARPFTLRGLKVDYRSVWAFVHASEQDRPDVARRRRQWKRYQGRVDLERLVFIDETWAKTNMAPLRGWAPRGERLRDKVPHRRWRTMTFLAALRHDRIDAPWVIEGPINGEKFRTYVEAVLVPRAVTRSSREPLAAEAH